jgi:hypothetical protein
LELKVNNASIILRAWIIGLPLRLVSTTARASRKLRQPRIRRCRRRRPPSSISRSPQVAVSFPSTKRPWPQSLVPQRAYSDFILSDCSNEEDDDPPAGHVGGRPASHPQGDGNGPYGLDPRSAASSPSQHVFSSPPVTPGAQGPSRTVKQHLQHHQQQQPYHQRLLGQASPSPPPLWMNSAPLHAASGIMYQTAGGSLSDDNEPSRVSYLPPPQQQQQAGGSGAQGAARQREPLGHFQDTRKQCKVGASGFGVNKTKTGKQTQVTGLFDLNQLASEEGFVCSCSAKPLLGSPCACNVYAKPSQPGSAWSTRTVNNV